MQSDVVGVAIGLFTVFLVFSLVVSGANEAINTVLHTRSGFLLKGLHQLLENDDARTLTTGRDKMQQTNSSSTLLGVTNVLTHPLAWSAAKPTFGADTNTDKRPPSYLDPRTFAQIAVDLLSKPETDAQLLADAATWAGQQSAPLSTEVNHRLAGEDPTTGAPLDPAPDDAQKVANLRDYAISLGPAQKQAMLAVLTPPATPDQIIRQVRTSAAGLPPVVREAVTALVDDAQGDLDRLRNNFANWFDSQMDRVSGWYKRRAFIISMIIGLGLAFFCSVNAIGISPVSFLPWAGARFQGIDRSSSSMNVTSKGWPPPVARRIVGSMS